MLVESSARWGVCLVGPVAQGLEQSAHNRSVGGSIPSGPTNICLGLNLGWGLIVVRCDEWVKRFPLKQAGT